MMETHPVYVRSTFGVRRSGCRAYGVSIRMSRLLQGIRRWWRELYVKSYSTEYGKGIARLNGSLMLFAWPFFTVLFLGSAIFEWGGWYKLLVAVGFSVGWLGAALFGIRGGRR